MESSVLAVFLGQLLSVFCSETFFWLVDSLFFFSQPAGIPEFLVFLHCLLEALLTLEAMPCCWGASVVVAPEWWGLNRLCGVCSGPCLQLGTGPQLPISPAARSLLSRSQKWATGLA